MLAMGKGASQKQKAPAIQGFLGNSEATGGFEPPNEGLAGLFVTLRSTSFVNGHFAPEFPHPHDPQSMGRAMASINNLVIGLFNRQGFDKHTQGRRLFEADPAQALALILGL